MINLTGETALSFGITVEIELPWNSAHF